MSKGNPVDIILTYMTTQNRPYSVNDIVANLHNEHGKTVVQRSVDKLVETGKLREKVYGKQKVYLVDQGGMSQASNEELNAMDKEIETKENTLREAEGRLKEFQSHLKELNSSLTTAEAKSQVEKLEKEVGEIKGKLKGFEDTTKLVPPQVRERMKEDKEIVVKAWRMRRRIANEVINTIMEGYPKNKEAFFEDTGVEVDPEGEALFKEVVANK